MSNYNINRQEAYRFYRSLGFSATEARSMRSRGPERIIKEYRRERVKANKLLENKKVDKYIKIYRPKVRGNKKFVDTFITKMERYGVSQKIIDLMQSDNAINQDIYLKRIRKLKKFFTDKDQNWNEMIEQISTISDLGDMLDFLGERYDDLKDEPDEKEN